MALILLVTLSGCGASEIEHTIADRGMEPKWRNGSVVTVTEIDDYQPQRGDVVLVRLPGVGLALRRVVALGGEEISCCDSRHRLYVDAQPQDEPYSTLAGFNQRTGDGCALGSFGPVSVPQDEIFVLNDKRTVPSDSRCLGPVPRTAVVGVLQPA